MLSRSLALARTFLAASSLLALSCAHAPPPLDDPGAADYYRARLAESPRGSRAMQVRDALEGAEFEGAKRKGTILAWRTFLAEFPDGPHRRDARTLLESLRWSEASAANTEQALTGFLADEPLGAHAVEAWSRIAGIRLEVALQTKSASAIRGWLASYPAAGSAVRDRAAKALEEAELSEAMASPAQQRRALLQSFVAAHPDGARRAEAESLEAKTAIDEAELLADQTELRAWVRSGNDQAARAASRVALEDAASRLDASDLAELAGARSPEAERAKAILAELKRLGTASRKLVDEVRALHLPGLRNPPGELPSTPRERARAIRELALALDGRALPQLFTELSAHNVWVGQAALESALLLSRSLPADELQLRAARAAAALLPIAQDGPHLGALALALAAAGDVPGALAQSRAAAARDPRSIVVQQLAARLEAEQGDRSLALVAARNLAAAVRASIAARAPAAAVADAAQAGSRAEPDEAPTLWSLCAGWEAAAAAEEIVAMQTNSRSGAEEDQARQAAASDTHGTLAAAERAVSAAERSAHKEGACALERASLLDADRRRGEARAEAFRALLDHREVAAEALRRAIRRDPSPAVRAVATASGLHPDSSTAATLKP